MKIIAVSKLQPVEKIRELYQRGYRSFAENYVQEALDKQDRLQDLNDLEWHFIGNLQKNKAKLVVGRFALIHSVDNLALAQKLSQLALDRKIQQNILVQINLAQEATKGGIAKESLEAFLQQAERLPGIKVVGLMTMPPLFENPEDARPYFQELRKLAEKYRLAELSMGTSSDHKVAEEEGATMVRLGTVLFGARPHKN